LLGGLHIGFDGGPDEVRPLSTALSPHDRFDPLAELRVILQIQRKLPTVDRHCLITARLFVLDKDRQRI